MHRAAAALDTPLAIGPARLPNRVFLGGTTGGSLPLLENKFLGGTTVFVCENKVCLLPVGTVEDALKQLAVR